MNGQNPQDINNMNGNVLGSVNISNATNPNNVGAQAPITNNTPNMNPTPGVRETSNWATNTGASQEVLSQVNNNTYGGVVNNNPNPPMANVEAPKPSEPVAVPIPGTSEAPEINSLTGNTIGSGNTGMMNQGNVNNSFINTPKAENIGAVPPPMPEGKKKKGMNKTLFAVIVILLIFGVAAGVYYLLNMSKSKVTLTTKDVTIGVGETLPDKINEYVTVTKGDLKNCSINLRNVNVNTIGEYEYSVTCGDDVFKGKVKVSDITAPKAKLNVVFLPTTGTLKLEDFVASCEDESKCTTSFANEEAAKGNLATPGGPYKVAIDATDDNGNKETFNADLYVTLSEIKVFNSCTSPSTEISNYQASKVTTDVFPVGYDENNVLISLGIARRDYVYTFTSKEEYQKAIGEKNATITFDGLTGEAIYDDENLKLTISTDLPLSTLNTENNGTFPLNFSEFQKLYKETKGYTCSNNRNYVR